MNPEIVLHCSLIVDKEIYQSFDHVLKRLDLIINLSPEKKKLESLKEMKKTVQGLQDQLKSP